MIEFVVAAAIVIAGIGVAAVIRRRDAGQMAQGRRWSVPAQLERRDFADPEADRLVVVFSSDTCDVCAQTWQQVNELVTPASGTAVDRVSYQDRSDLHDRYGIAAVPTLLVADGEGVVQRSFVGPPDAAELAEVLTGGE
ncbi:MAG TPA: thioredoxin family protein [Acidimicrobiales bacterium]|nr:thioredoxin family protein [Acidimicrobiales bacterium]